MYDSVLPYAPGRAPKKDTSSEDEFYEDIGPEAQAIYNLSMLLYDTSEIFSEEEEADKQRRKEELAQVARAIVYLVITCYTGGSKS